MDVVTGELVELVDGDERRLGVGGGGPRALDEEVEEGARVQTEGQSAEPESVEHRGRCRDDLGLDHRGRGTEHVDVALGKLAKAAILRSLGAPNGADLVAFEDRGQLAAM